MKKLGTRIKQARRESSLSQLELGVALKVSDKTISGYESGRISPPIDKLLMIANLLKKPVSFFLGVDDKDYSIQSRLRALENKLTEVRDELRSLKVLAKKKK